jgi:hypothetical protein
MQSFNDQLPRPRPTDADRLFRLGKLGASLLTAVLVCGVSLLVLDAELLAQPRFEGQRLPVPILLAAGLLLALGAALRVARGGSAQRRGSATRGLRSGVFHGVAREMEIATGFVSSVLAGVAVASNAAAANAIGGWVTSAAGLPASTSATITVALIAAIGTVLTDVARGGISRAVRESAAFPTLSQ